MATPALGTASPQSFSLGRSEREGVDPPDAGAGAVAAQPPGLRACCAAGICQPWVSAPWAPGFFLFLSPLPSTLSLPPPCCRPS